MKKPFDDLKETIKQTLNFAANHPSQTTNIALVPIPVLKILQAEYNIYFVEPEDEQLEIL